MCGQLWLLLPVETCAVHTSQQTPVVGLLSLISPCPTQILPAGTGHPFCDMHFIFLHWFIFIIHIFIILKMHLPSLGIYNNPLWRPYKAADITQFTWWNTTCGPLFTIIPFKLIGYHPWVAPDDWIQIHFYGKQPGILLKKRLLCGDSIVHRY